MRGKWVAAVAATTMTMAACGGSSKTDGAAGGATTAAPAATASATTVPAPTTNAPVVTDPPAAEVDVTEAEVADTEIAVDDTFPTLDTEAPIDYTFTGDGSGEFCDMVRDLDANDPINSAFDSTDPAVSKAAWDEVASSFDKLEGVAPDEIAEDVRTLGGVFDTMKTFFAGFDFDMVAAGTAMQQDPQMVALFSGEDPTAQNASDRLDAYGVQVCGLAS